MTSFYFYKNQAANKRKTMQMLSRSIKNIETLIIFIQKKMQTKEEIYISPSIELADSSVIVSVPQGITSYCISFHKKKDYVLLNFKSNYGFLNKELDLKEEPKKVETNNGILIFY